MDRNKDDYCIILAGGKGRRLWPCSRENCPKQFIDFFGTGRTQLQSTYYRFANFIPQDNILVTTNEDYADLLNEQLPQLSRDNAVLEPVARNTAPSVAAATLRIAHRNPNARIIIAPSDQYVKDEDVFTQNILHALDIVGQHDMLLTLGVKPARPEPGYGYIQLGDLTDCNGIYHVKSFTEKPEREFAKVFVDSGEFYWNVGMFLSNVKNLGRALYHIFPDLISVEQEKEGGNSFEERMAFIKKNYDTFPNIPIDSSLFEHGENVCVMKCDFGWADLGTWHSMYEFMRRSDKDNVLINTQALLENCKDNIIKLPEGKLAVISGLDGYIVAEKDNVLFICKKGDSSALVRKYVNEVQIRFGDDYL